MADGNVGQIRFRFSDVRDQIIRDEVRLTLVNQTMRTRDRQATLLFQGRSKTLKGVPAHPNGHYQLFITPTKYRHKSVFVGVRPNKTEEVTETVLLDPEEVTAAFPAYQTLNSETRWTDLFNVFDASGISADEYKDLGDLEKGGLFNLHAKMQKQEVAGGRKVFSYVETIERITPQRIYARVGGDLVDQVRRYEKGFHSVDGTLHEFPTGWSRVASFKTREKMGNLQLTFARNSAGQFIVDADIDDHQGVQHAFDVLKYRFTGKNTHPFDIHQILILFQDIDPGYELS